MSYSDYLRTLLAGVEENKMKEHPLSEYFPMLPPEEYEQLKASIKDHGLREAIVLLDGMILDGRNRYKACLEAEVEPRFEEYQGSNGALDFIVDMNMRRRHLEAGQKGQIIMNIEGTPEAGTSGPKSSHPETRTPSFSELAKKAGVTDRIIADIASVQDTPELKKKLYDGTITAGKASRERMKEVASKAEVLPTLEGMYAKAPDTKLLITYIRDYQRYMVRALENQFGLDKIDPQGHTPFLIAELDKVIELSQQFKTALEDLRNG